MEPLNLKGKFWAPQKLKITSFLDDLRVLELKYERVCMGVHTHAHPCTPMHTLHTLLELGSRDLNSSRIDVIFDF